MLLNCESSAHYPDRMDLPVNKEIFDLKVLIAKAVAQVGIEADSRGLFLEATMPPEIDRYFKGDPRKIRQIILDLAEHGLRTMETGCQTMRFDALCLDGLQRYKILVDIANAGPGIPEEKKAALFQPVKGAGVNSSHSLFRARKLAEELDGAVSLHSFFG